MCLFDIDFFLNLITDSCPTTSNKTPYTCTTGGLCYWFDDSNQEGEAAKQTCISQGGTLIMMKDKTTRDWIDDNLRRHASYVIYLHCVLLHAVVIELIMNHFCNA